MAERAAGRVKADHGTGRGATRTTGRGSRARASARPPLRLVANTRPAKDPLQVTRRSIALLLLPAFTLTLVGIVEVLSASSDSAYEELGSSFFFFNRQVIYAAIGVVALVAAWRLPYRAWQRLSVPLLIASLGLMLLALHPAAGTSAYGASRWIVFGPITVQPSELAKLAMVAFTATVLVRKWSHLHEPMHLAVPLGPVVAIVTGIVLLQRDLGTTVIVATSVYLVLFAAGVRLRFLFWTGLAGLAAAAALIFGETYRRERFLIALDPWKDPLDKGYQQIQGYIALGSGGWWGVGPGAGRQTQYVPNAHTDFIFAILGEELGLFGELVVIAMFAILVYAGVRIAMNASDTFGRLLAIGITSWLGVQAIVNLGAVTGLLPITGVPLPFVSFGGSALVVSLTGVGVLASIARESGTVRARKARRAAA